MSERRETTFTLRYSVERRIAAPAATLWAKLTDGPNFTKWNTTVSKLDGDIALGGHLRLQVPLAPGRTFSPKVVVFEPATRMVWQDGFFPMFQGTRTFTLTPEGDATRFVMTEHFRGLMLPMIKGSLPDFGPAFDRYAEDLQRACEVG